jgi:hypothetical protein
VERRAANYEVKILNPLREGKKVCSFNAGNLAKFILEILQHL